MNENAPHLHHDRPGRKPARPHQPTPLGSHRHGKGWAPKGKNGMQRYRMQSGFAAMHTGKGPRKAMRMYPDYAPKGLKAPKIDVSDIAGTTPVVGGLLGGVAALVAGMFGKRGRLTQRRRGAK